MKKDILFVMNNLHCGGAEKALISLLETIDYSKYNVDLLLFKKEGLFLTKVPKEVNLLDEPKHLKYFDMPIKKALVEILSKREFKLIVARILFGYIYRTEKNRARCEQLSWKYLSKSLDKVNKNYDVAIGYLEKNPIYFCVEKVRAHQKIGFIHNDYNKLGMDPKLDINYFKSLNRIITVSEQCAIELKRTFPTYKSKIDVMFNIVSPNMIYRMARDKIELNDGLKILSIGRLNYQKGFEMAIEACKLLVDNGYDITWYVIGEGEERENLQNMINNLGLKERFLLLGVKENPYPYIQNSDIYVQPSRFEGKSVAIDEAKLLNKPIVVTNFSTAKDQIVDEENGLIVNMDPLSIYCGIKRLLDDECLRMTLINTLKTTESGTEGEIEIFYKFLSAV